MGWLDGCCGLPAWVCPEGRLQPIEAHFCGIDGEERPHPSRMVHERLGGSAPRVVRRALELSPASDGLSTPCLAGNVLVYLTETGRLVAVDMASEATLFLAVDVHQASCRLDRGMVRAALRVDAGVRYCAWDVRDLRDGLAEFTEVDAIQSGGAGSKLLGLPHNRTRLHMGSGLVRLVVEHDPVDGALADLYKETTGVWPGPWLIRRTANPDVAPVNDIDLRPQDLWQVPVPIPGGILVIGAVRAGGVLVSGALVIPNHGAHW